MRVQSGESRLPIGLIVPKAEKAISQKQIKKRSPIRNKLFPKQKKTFSYRENAFPEQKKTFS